MQKNEVVGSHRLISAPFPTLNRNHATYAEAAAASEIFLKLFINPNFRYIMANHHNHVCLGTHNKVKDVTQLTHRHCQFYPDYSFKVLR